jgi:hypothetical protein
MDEEWEEDLEDESVSFHKKSSSRSSRFRGMVWTETAR